MLIVDGSSKSGALVNGAKAAGNGGHATMGVDVGAAASMGAKEGMMGASANNSMAGGSIRSVVGAGEGMMSASANNVMAGGGVRSVVVGARAPALLLANCHGGPSNVPCNPVLNP